MPIDRGTLIDFLVRLLETPSPSGHTAEAMAVVEEALGRLGLTPRRTQEGSAVCQMPGASAAMPRAIVAHVDTLGAMVKEVEPSGRLRLTQIGHFAWNTIEGEGLTVFCYNGRCLRGSVLCTQAADPIYGSESEGLRRSDETLEVRLDELVQTAAQARSLGVEVGGLVAFDPRAEVSEGGRLRGRHRDDKAGVACVLAPLQPLRAAGVEPAQRATIMISNHEEVSHGAVAGRPADVVEEVTVDLAVVGEGQTSEEHPTTLCAKDSGGPYDPALSARLRRLGETVNLPLCIDTYPHYSSDSPAVWRTPADVRVALHGPRIDASNNCERTQLDALVSTAQLHIEYLRP